jgi:hypothetical protein
MEVNRVEPQFMEENRVEPQFMEFEIRPEYFGAH